MAVVATRRRRTKHSIRFSEEARAHLLAFSVRERRTVLDRIRATLQDEPTVETRNLKVLRPNPIANYELRVGVLRVFFEVDGRRREVLVLAIGRKEGSLLRVGGKGVPL
jgi:mRNA-degrading endonuclease RelE of RelBE toxin-antitoxin system